MVHRFTVLIGDVSEEQVDRLAEICPDSLSGVSRGRAYIDFAREAESLGSAIDSALEDLVRLNINVLSVQADEPATAV